MNVDLESILNTFVQRSAVRRNMFETYFTILIDVVTIHVQAYCNIFKIVVCDLSSTNNQTYHGIEYDTRKALNAGSRWDRAVILFLCPV